MRNPSASWALLTLSCIGACGGKTSNSREKIEVPAPDPQHFNSTLAKYFCGVLKGCCDRQSLPYDDNACVSQVSGLYGTMAANANVTYDATAAQQCITDMQLREELCLDDTAEVVQVPSCDRVFQGKLAPGAPCKSNEECATDPDPKITSRAVCEGTCQLSREVVPVGGQCQKKNGPTTEDCANGLSCASSPTCPEIPTVGGTCLGGGSVPCAAGSHCSADSCNHQLPGPCYGTCELSLPEGSACTFDGDCKRGLACFQQTCIVQGASHFFDISRRSCSIGPLSDGLDDGSLISKN